MKELLSSLSQFDILLSVFLLSLPLGSFYNVVAQRTLSSESFLSFDERSRCDSCGHQLHWNDLMPVLSWLLLKGKCRYCKTHVPGFYSLWEFFTAVSYTFIIYRFGFTVEALIQIILFTILIWSSVTDYIQRTVPSHFIIIGYSLITTLMIYSDMMNDPLETFTIPLMALLCLYLLGLRVDTELIISDYLLYGLIAISSEQSIAIITLIMAAIGQSIGRFLSKEPAHHYFIPYLTWSLLIVHLVVFII